MKRSKKVSILSAAALAAAAGLNVSNTKAALVADWLGDNYTTGSNWTATTGGYVASGSATAVTSAFGAHTGVQMNLSGQSGGFTLPKGTSIAAGDETPPGGSSAWSVAVVFDPTANDTAAGGQVYNTSTLFGYDVGGGGTPDLGLAWGNGRVLGGIGRQGGDSVIASGTLALNQTHVAVLQADPTTGTMSFWVDGKLAGQNTGLTFLTMDPSKAGGAFGLGGQFVRAFPGLVGEVQVYTGTPLDGAALSNSLGAQYGGQFSLYTWTGTTGAFNLGSNWDLGTAPNNVSNRARISNGGTAQLSTDTSLADLYLGDNVGTQTGTLTQTAGTLNVTSSFYVGHSGGTGTYDISGGTLNYTGASDKLQLNGNATAAGNMIVHGNAVVTATGGQVVIGENVNNVGGNGHMTIADNASFTDSNEFWVGDGAGSTGTLDMTGGTLSVNNWVAIGRTSGTGVVNLSGGTFSQTNSGTNVTFAGNSGILNQTGGSFNVAGQVYLAEGGGQTGTWNMSGGTANIQDARVGIGGVGTINQTGNANFTAYYMTVAPGSGGTGTWNVNGGTATVTERLYAGENGNGTVNVGGTGTLSVDNILIGSNLGATANVNLNAGGTIAANFIIRGAAATANLNLNGGILQAKSDQANFLTGFSNNDVHLLAGGVTVDTNGHAIGLSSSLSGTGAVTKMGVGTLTINAGSASTYSGNTTIAAGTLKLAHTVYNNSVHAIDIAAYYKLNDPNNLLADSSSHHNDLLSASGKAVYSASAPAGHTGSLSLANNTADYLSSQTADFSAPSNFPLGNSSYTLAAWVNLDNLNTANGGANGIIGWGDYGTGRAVNALRTAGTTGGIQNYWWNADITRNPSSPVTMVGNWHYVTATYDNTTNLRTLYLDGVSLGSDSPGTDASTANNFAIGRTNPGVNNTTAEFFSGNLSDVLVANSALSASDIQSAMTNGVSFGTYSADGALSTASAVAIASGATLDLDGTTQTVAGLLDSNGSGGSVTSTVAGASSLTLAPTSARSFSGVISDGSGTVSLTVASGSQTLAGANTYTGNTNVTGGTLTLASTGSIASTNVTVSTGGTLAANGATNAGLSASTVLTSNGATTIAAATGATSSVTVASVNIGTTGSVALTNSGNTAIRKVLVTGALTFAGSSNAWGGKLDLQSNDLIVHNGNLDTLTNQLKQGYNGGTGNGTAGIVNSSPVADTLHTLGIAQGITGTYDGQSVVATDAFVKYTYYGDADLNGVVNGNDYTQIDNSFSSKTGSGWQNGDFNYDGKIDGSDYSLIDNAFNRQSGSLAASSATMVASSSSEVASAGAAVPEPTSLGLISLGAMGLIGRRRRKI